MKYNNAANDSLIIDHNEIQRRAQLTTWFTGVITLAIAIATLMIPLLTQNTPGIFILVGMINTVATGLLWLWFRTGIAARCAPTLFMIHATVIAVPAIAISGGPNSPFTSVIPLFPLLGVLVSGKRLAIASLVFWVTFLPASVFIARQIPDFTGQIWLTDQTITRAFWLILSSGVGLLCALYFEKRTRELQNQLVGMAEQDPLTGIGNRRMFESSLTRQLALSERHDRWLTLMLIDVDHFKRYNDERGHADGDAALREVARELTRQTREGQDTVARFGGEEFVLVLGETDGKAARVVAEKIRVTIKGLGLCYNNDPCDVLTVTIGYASVPGNSHISPDALLRRADAALYHGKLTGRDRVVSVDTLHELSLPHRVMEPEPAPDLVG